MVLSPLLYGVIATLGHSYSIFIGFKGGKGVSTGFGAVFAYLPIIIIAGVAVIYIFTSAPIDTASKRLDNDECREYGKRAKILAVLLIMLSVMLYIFNISNIACTVAIGIIFEGLLMICGYVQNIRNGETL